MGNVSVAIDRMIEREGRDITYRTYPNASLDQANRTRTLGTPTDTTIKAIVRERVTERSRGTLIYEDMRELLIRASDGPPEEDSKYIIDGEEEVIKDWKKMQQSGVVMAYRVILE